MKKIFDRMFGQYKGLRRELYVLFWGKAATNMGAMIWPMLTLILSNKLGMSAEEIARITIAMGIIQFPANLLGGKLADHCNKKNLIVVCDLVTVTCYLTAAFLPVSMTQIMLFFTAGVFQTMENPSYDALVADLSTAENREKAYSLIYLGLNLGLILAPSIGGILFQHHLGLAYAIDGLTTLSSTILILLFIKDIAPVKEEKNIYEEAKDTQSTWKILSGQKVILLFLICWAVYQFSYAQFNFLIPLNMESLYGGQGAVYFGLMTSLNGLVVIVGTPLLTKWAAGLGDTTKLLAGQILVSISLSMYIFIQGIVPLYYVSMILFTIGEVMTTLGSYPYLTRRIPASHRGRISSVSNIFLGAAMYYSQWKIGAVLETHTIMTAWQCVAAAGVLGLILYLVLIKADRKVYPLLYKK
ncbi:MAG: MFS transporter [Blautia sp.]|nr:MULTISPECIES: MFS transporter [Blautia]